jgi:hypothetical protein
MQRNLGYDSSSHDSDESNEESSQENDIETHFLLWVQTIEKHLKYSRGAKDGRPFVSMERNFTHRQI